MLKGGRLLTISHGTIENGVLVIAGGKISAIGAANSVNVPKDAEVIDVTGMTVYPGLIDSESYLGLTEISAEDSTNDLIETSDETMPHMHVYDATCRVELIPVAPSTGSPMPSWLRRARHLPARTRSFNSTASRPTTAAGARHRHALNFTGSSSAMVLGKRKFPQTHVGTGRNSPEGLMDAQDYSALGGLRKEEVRRPETGDEGPPTPPRRSETGPCRTFRSMKAIGWPSNPAIWSCRRLARQ